MFSVEDGMGRGYQAAVNKDHHLEVESNVRQLISFVSIAKGLAFSLTSHDAAAAANDFVWYLKNTSLTRDLIISTIRVSAVQSVLWKLWFVSGTATGTSLTPTNNSRKSGNAAEATALGNGAVSGLTAEDQIGTIRTAAANHGFLQLEQAVVLGTNDAIAIEYDTGTGGIAEVFGRFFYIERDM